MIELPFPAKILWPNGRGHWSDEELAILQCAYRGAACSKDIDLPGLAARLGRLKSNVCRKARSLGLTDNKRRYVAQRKNRRKYESPEALRAAQPEIARRRIREHGHPRGMAGKKHSEETKARIGVTSAKRWAKMSKAEISDNRLKALQTAAANGTTRAHERGTWKAGWREIGGKRNYYRSRWEANYARYLEWLKARGEIKDWQHEPETFWFEAIRRGVRSYLPDFRVWENSGATPLHEVKGWMDARSKTTLRRMKKYHPSETVIVIREKGYNAIARTVGPLIQEWEQSERAGRW